jgi:hypothetical protein
MDLGIRLGDIVLSMFSFLFPFWPLLILAPALSKGNVIGKMLLLWLVFLLVRITLVFSPLPKVDFLIREPMNTLLFLAAGVAIFLGAAVRRLRRRA